MLKKTHLKNQIFFPISKLFQLGLNLFWLKGRIIKVSVFPFKYLLLRPEKTVARSDNNRNNISFKMQKSNQYESQLLFQDNMSKPDKWVKGKEKWYWAKACIYVHYYEQLFGLYISDMRCLVLSMKGCLEASPSKPSPGHTETVCTQPGRAEWSACFLLDSSIQKGCLI